jgi:DNA-binding IclR family transcriptional regulator
MQIEDHLVPYARLAPGQRCFYYDLFRHSRLLGQRTVCVSQTGLARGAEIGEGTVRRYLRTLAQKGCVKIMQRSRLTGSELESRLAALQQLHDGALLPALDSQSEQPGHVVSLS